MKLSSLRSTSPVYLQARLNKHANILTNSSKKSLSEPHNFMIFFKWYMPINVPLYLNLTNLECAMMCANNDVEFMFMFSEYTPIITNNSYLSMDSDGFKISGTVVEFRHVECYLRNTDCDHFWCMHACKAPLWLGGMDIRLSFLGRKTHILFLWFIKKNSYVFYFDMKWGKTFKKVVYVYDSFQIIFCSFHQAFH